MDITMVKKTATPIYPIHVASPTAIARKILVISCPLPGADLNLTRLKAPATATPAPILPLTSIITSSTIAGSMMSVIAKLLEHLFLTEYPAAIMNPQTRDVSVTTANCADVKIPSVKIDSTLSSQ